MARQKADVLVTMIDEIAYAVGILRSHYPEDSETELRARAEVLRANRYQSGRWPFDDVAPAPVEAEPPVVFFRVSLRRALRRGVS